MPSTSPTPRAMVAAVAPACSEAWAPQMTRLNMSRPNSSVPIQCAALGGSCSTRKSCRVGLYGLTCAAKTAARVTATSTKAPNNPGRELKKRRRAAVQGVGAWRTTGAAVNGAAGERTDSDETATSVVANAWVERCVHDVDQKIERDHEQGDDDDRPLDHRVVARG